MLNRVNKLLDFLVKFSQIVLGLVILAMALSNVIQVVTRYMVSVQVLWVEDVSMLGLYWIFALGTPMCWILRQHLSMNAFEDKMSPKLRKNLWIAQNVIGVLGGAGLVYLGIRTMRLNAGFIMSAIGFDEAFRYVPLVVCGVYMMIVCILLLIKIFLEKEVEA